MMQPQRILALRLRNPPIAGSRHLNVITVVCDEHEREVTQCVIQEGSLEEVMPKLM